MNLTSRVGTTKSSPPYVTIGANDSSPGASMRGVLRPGVRVGATIKPGTRTAPRLTAGSAG